MSKKIFDFSVLDNMHRLNEDVIDSFDDEIVNSQESASRDIRKVGSIDDDLEPAGYSHYMTVTYELKNKGIDESIYDYFAVRIMDVLNNCPAIECAAPENFTIENIVLGNQFGTPMKAKYEFPNIPKETDFLHEWIWKSDYMKFAGAMLMFGISYEPNDGLTLRQFTKVMIDTMEKFGRNVLWNVQDDIILAVYGEKYDCETISLNDRPDFRHLYKLFYGEDAPEDDQDDERRIREISRSSVNFDMICKSMEKRALSDDLIPSEIVSKGFKWISENSILLKVEITPTEDPVLEYKFVPYLVKKYILQNVSGEFLKNYNLGISVTSKKQITGADNKTIDLPLRSGQRIPNSTRQSRYFGTRDQVLDFEIGEYSKKPFYSCRFVMVRFLRNDE